MPATNTREMTDGKSDYALAGRLSDWRTNRERTRAPRRAGGWCRGCDRHFVAIALKCPACGTRNGRRRNKN